MIFKCRNELQRGQAAQRRQQAVYYQRQDGNCWHVFGFLWADVCQTDQITLLANLTFPLQTIDKQDLAVRRIYHNDIIWQSTSTVLSKFHHSMGDHSDR